MEGAPVRIRHKATKLYLHIENRNDLWSRDLDDAEEFPTKAEAIKAAKKYGLNSKEYEII